MFRNVTVYAPINAVVRALYSRHLTPTTKRAFIQAPDFDALLNLLANTTYGPYLTPLHRATLTPRRAVYQIRLHLAASYHKLIRLTPEPGRQLLIHLWRVYEIDNLKAVLRGVAAQASWDQVRHLLFPTLKYNTLTPAAMERMLRSSDVRHAIERLSDSPYYDTLIHAVERYTVEQNLFPLEVALDLTYRRAFWDSLARLKGEDLRQARHLIGTQLDVDNLLWAIRYRVYHHLSPQEIINYTLPQGYQVTDADIRAIAAGENIARVVQRIYAHLPELENLKTESRGAPLPPQEWLLPLERSLNTHVAALCKRAFNGPPFHIGVPLAYLLLSEREIEALTAIIEGKAQNVASSALTHILDF